MSNLTTVAAVLADPRILAVNAPDDTPPGIFLRIFIFGGLAMVIGIAWFVLRGYRNSGDNDRK